ncbi:MAG TPA: HIT family protein [Azospirillaceae bacterium]|nr:HIT family protein [Azospirillaceae bacterium]
MSNPTLLKFGYPDTLVAGTPTWSVLVRPQQVTLGSLVLVCRDPVTAFGQVSPAAFAGLQPVVQAVEHMLGEFVGYQRINYLMLMMVDPDVHFHVIPRYEGEREFRGRIFPDTAWPGPPNLANATALPEEDLQALVQQLKAHWPGATG